MFNFFYFISEANIRDHVYLRHLSAECRSILSADMATDTRPIYRPTLGRVSVDMNRQACRPTPGRYFTATRPRLGRHWAATRPILYQHSANTKLTWSALGTEIFPALLREAFSGRRPFLALTPAIFMSFFSSYVCSSSSLLYTTLVTL